MLEKYILITGSTDGIGKAGVIEIMKRTKEETFFFIHGRNNEKCGKAIEEFRKLDTKQKHEFSCLTADLTSLDQVRKVPMFLEDVTDKLDVLINNAGVYMPQKILTGDGFEATFQINYLSHYLLTRLLLPFIAESKEGRIIHVSSMVHARSIDFENLNGEKYYDGYEAYSLSKLANILFSNELHDRLRGKGYSNITTNSLHPGVISTKLLHSGWGVGGMPTSEGGKRLAFLALSDKVRNVSGKYFVNDRESAPAPIAHDKETKTRLWEISSKFVELPVQLVEI